MERWIQSSCPFPDSLGFDFVLLDETNIMWNCHQMMFWCDTFWKPNLCLLWIFVRVRLVLIDVSKQLCGRGFCLWNMFPFRFMHACTAAGALFLVYISSRLVSISASTTSQSGLRKLRYRLLQTSLTVFVTICTENLPVFRITQIHVVLLVAFMNNLSPAHAIPPPFPLANETSFVETWNLACFDCCTTACTSTARTATNAVEGADINQKLRSPLHQHWLTFTETEPQKKLFFF